MFDFNIKETINKDNLNKALNEGLRICEEIAQDTNSPTSREILKYLQNIFLPFGSDSCLMGVSVWYYQRAVELEMKLEENKLYAYTSNLFMLPIKKALLTCHDKLESIFTAMEGQVLKSGVS